MRLSTRRCQPQLVQTLEVVKVDDERQNRDQTREHEIATEENEESTRTQKVFTRQSSPEWPDASLESQRLVVLEEERGEGVVIDMRVRGIDGWRIEESRSPAFYRPEEVKRRSANFSSQPPSKKGKSNIANFVVPLADRMEMSNTHVGCCLEVTVR